MKPSQPKQTTEIFLAKHGAILARLRSGETCGAVGKDVGLCRESIRRIKLKFDRLEASLTSSNPLDSLSIRAQNCLYAEDLDTVEKIRVAANNRELSKIINLGKTTIAEILAWLEKIPE